MKIFYYEFTVSEDAIDVNHHANNAHYVIWMQEAANAHSNAVGDLIKTNLAQNRTWMVRRHEIDYLGQLLLDDKVRVKTWTQPEKRSCSKRFYEFSKDGVPVASAVTTYVFFDLSRGRSIAIPPEIARLYED